MSKKGIKDVIAPQLVFGLDELLDYLVENKVYQAQFGLDRITFTGIVEDTVEGKRKVFQIIRKVEE